MDTTIQTLYRDIILKIQDIKNKDIVWTIEDRKRSYPFHRDFIYSLDNIYLRISAYNENSFTLDVTTSLGRIILEDNYYSFGDSSEDIPIEFILPEKLTSLYNKDNLLGLFRNSFVAKELYYFLQEKYPAEPSISDEGMLLNKINKGLQDLIDNLQ